jgi:hypothetical protein
LKSFNTFALVLLQEPVAIAALVVPMRAVLLWPKGKAQDLRGTVVAQGDTYEEALADAKSAIQFHIETFGPQVQDHPPPEAGA